VKREIYLDANASHPLLDRVKSRLGRQFDEENIYGNASSLHGAGRRSKKLLSLVRAELQSATGLEAGGWTFTSGATEAINTILHTALLEGISVAVSDVEHSAVLKFCEKRIPETKRIPVSRCGELDLDFLSRYLASLDPHSPFLLVLQSHNNETGLPLLPRHRQAEFKAIVATHPGLRIAWDAVQSLGKSDIDSLKFLLEGSHYVAVSGHKMGALSGIGALWKASSSPLKPFLIGGSQEQGLRAGTEPVWSALSWLEALREWNEVGHVHREHWQNLKTVAVDSMREISRVQLIEGSTSVEALPNTLAMLVLGSRSDVVLQKLDLEGICVSSGSACLSGIAQASQVLGAMGYSEEETRSFIRVSMPARCRKEDIETFVLSLKRILS
jgi:cysteine desulfurase